MRRNSLPVTESHALATASPLEKCFIKGLLHGLMQLLLITVFSLVPSGSLG